MIPSELPVFGVFAQHNALPMLICAIVTGYMAGIFCDIAAICNAALDNNRILKFFFDFSVVLFAYLAIFVCALNFSDGIIRWYHAVLVLCGYKAYFATLSRFVVYVTKTVLRICMRLIKAICAVIMIPTRFVVRMFSRISHFANARFNYFIKEKTFKDENKKMLRMASVGFGLTDTDEAVLNKIEKRKKGNGKQKNKQTRRNRDSAGIGFSDNSMLQTSDGAQPTA